MADTLQTKRDNALEFLDELDGKHDFLLTELDSLNARLDKVLAEYAKSRQVAAGGVFAAAPAVLVPAEHVFASQVEVELAPKAELDDASSAASPANLN